MLRRKALLTVISILFTLGLLEGGARLYLRNHQPQTALYPPQPLAPLPHEIPETLSQSATNGGGTWRPGPVYIHEATPYVHEGDLWLPPRSFKGDVFMIDDITHESVRRLRLTTDAQGRRMAPWQEERRHTAQKHLQIFGCSFSYGYGVNDGETFAARLSESNPALQTFNLSAGGYGLAELLIRARDGDGLAGIAPAEGAAMFVMAGFTIDRFNNSSQTVLWRPDGLELDEVTPGHFESRGPVYKAKPLWYAFSYVWQSSGLGRLIGRDYPAHDRAHLERFVRAIKELRKTYWEKTRPSNPFFVVMLPYSFDHRLLREILDREGISFIDYSQVDLSAVLSGPPAFPGEDHPTPEVHVKLAIALQRELDYFFKK